MCGRFFLDPKEGDFIGHFNMTTPEIFAPRFNIAPTTPVLAFTAKGFDFFRWGLIPSWAKAERMGSGMFNARAETIAEKPSFRNAYKRRRCLIPASGYYEWRMEAGRKQPYVCHLDQSLFSMAGIWEHWQDANGNEIQSCAIITTEASGSIGELHHRMPVNVRFQDYEAWLDCSGDMVNFANQVMLKTSNAYQFYPVDTAVGNARNEGPDLIRPLAGS